MLQRPQEMLGERKTSCRQSRSAGTGRWVCSRPQPRAWWVQGEVLSLAGHFKWLFSCVVSWGKYPAPMLSSPASDTPREQLLGQEQALRVLTHVLRGASGQLSSPLLQQRGVQAESAQLCPHKWHGTHRRRCFCYHSALPLPLPPFPGFITRYLSL